MVCLFLIVSFVWRTLGSVYIDLFGPINSTELGYELGPGVSTPLFVVSIMGALAIMVWFLSGIKVVPQNLGKTFLGLSLRTAPTLVFVVASIGIAIVYGDMISRGVIPLFVGMDRLEYKDTYAGPIYDIIYENCMLTSLTLGFFFVRSRIKLGNFDYRFAWLALALLLYFVLTGNRFSIFYVLAGYFVIPFAGYYVVKESGHLLPDTTRSFLHSLATGSRTRWLAGIVGVLFIVVLILNNFFNVRYDSDRASGALFQRVLVQPVELYFVTWDRIVTGELSDTSLAWDLMFGNPLDAARNTGIQYLMVNALGEARAMEVIDQQAQNAGGYPEVLLELFGKYMFILPLLLMATVTAFLCRMLAVACVYGRFMSGLMSVYLLFAFNTFYIGGMLNFFLPWTFWAKVAVYIPTLLLEPLFMRPPVSHSVSQSAVAPT